MKELIEDLYRTVFTKKAKNISRLFRGDFSVAEDIVQEAFTRALRFSHLYNPDKGNIETWFNAILINVVKDFRLNQEKVTGLAHELYTLRNTDPACITPTPEYWWYVSLKFSGVLNEKHKRVVELFFVYGYTSKEIALVEGTSVSNVTTIIKRFRKMVETDTGYR